jgi:hypothetical protein
MRTSYVKTLGLVAAALALPVFADTAGTLLFTQTGTQIVDVQGVARAAKRGDILSTGERLVTPSGAISQVKLPDGSLLAMRPGSEVKIDLPPQASPGAAQIISLQQGALRVIGSELMDAKKPSALTLQSGLATMKLTGADLESAFVRPGDAKPSGGGSGDSGSYNRLLTGAGSIGNGGRVEPLAARQTSFVGGVNLAPVTLAMASPGLFTGNVLPAPVVVNVNPGVGRPITLPVFTPPVLSKLPLVLPPVIIAPPKIIFVPPVPLVLPLTVIANGKKTGDFVDTNLTAAIVAKVAPTFAPQATIIVPSNVGAPVTTPIATVPVPILTLPNVTTVPNTAPVVGPTLVVKPLSAINTLSVSTVKSCTIGAIKIC